MQRVPERQQKRSEHMPGALRVPPETDGEVPYGYSPACLVECLIRARTSHNLEPV